MLQGFPATPVAAAVPKPIPIPAEATTAAPLCVPRASVVNAEETLDGDAVPRRRRWYGVVGGFDMADGGAGPEKGEGRVKATMKLG